MSTPVKDIRQILKTQSFTTDLALGVIILKLSGSELSPRHKETLQLVKDLRAELESSNSSILILVDVLEKQIPKN